MAAKQIVITGTFDILHPGHVFLISKAAELGEVTVIVARDNNVRRAKGHPVVIPEQQRLFMVQSLKGVSKAILGSQGSDIFQIIEELHPDILLLGPNQKVSVEGAQEELKKRNLKTNVRRLNEFFDKFPLDSTTGIIEQIFITRQSEP